MDMMTWTNLELRLVAQMLAPQNQKRVPTRGHPRSTVRPMTVDMVLAEIFRKHQVERTT